MCSAPGDDDGPRAVAAVREEERTLRAGDGATLREFVAQPATGFRRGAVLIIHDIWGYTDFYKDLARRITGQGHAALLVDFFGRQGDLPESMRAPEKTGSKPEAVALAMQRAQQLSDERFLADMQTAVDDLRARGADRVAGWGFCMGGRLAYLAAARVRGLAGIVAYYGFLQAEPGRLSPLQLASAQHRERTRDLSQCAARFSSLRHDGPQGRDRRRAGAHVPVFRAGARPARLITLSGEAFR